MTDGTYLPVMKYAHLTGAGTTTVKSFAGILHNITVNTAGTATTVYDNTAGSGTVIAILAATTIGTYTYDVGFATGLTIVTTGTPDITVAYY